MRLMVSLLIAAVMAGAAVPAFAADAYSTMVARIKSGDVGADFAALREAYAKSPKYQPYGGDYDDARLAMRKAFNIHDCKSVLSDAGKVLEAIYIDIASHLLSASCQETAGNEEKAGFHRAIARGLMDAILATGDGKTAKTAYSVVTISEEYDVLYMLGLNVETQALASEGGHVYDQIVAKSDKGDTQTLYFQIDRPMAWMSETLH
ncbi:MAG: DUF4919 domain-containing protein [Alphaproteobacteria bacterium]|nr:DUF4919 domain-containing protein [Alphaproteobacteria bacterium]